MLRISTSHLAQRHDAKIYQGAFHLITAEFDASHRFQFPRTGGPPVYDFVWLREPVARVLSQFAHHNAHDRFAGQSSLPWDQLI